MRPLPAGRSKKRRRVGIALALLSAGAALMFGPTLALNTWDAYVAHQRQAQTAQWMKAHLKHAAVRRPSHAAAGWPGVITPGVEGYLLEIPRLHLQVVVHMLEPIALTGVPTPILARYGLGEIPYTTVLGNVSPGGNGTAAIAGHRTTHGAPFRHLDALRPGDVLLVRKGATVQQWRVSNTAVIAPTDVDVIRSRPGMPRLILLACTPPFSAQSRLMVAARPAPSRPSVDVLAAPHVQTAAAARPPFQRLTARPAVGAATPTPAALAKPPLPRRPAAAVHAVMQPLSSGDTHAAPVVHRSGLPPRGSVPPARAMRTKPADARRATAGGVFLQRRNAPAIRIGPRSRLPLTNPRWGGRRASDTTGSRVIWPSVEHDRR